MPAEFSKNTGQACPDGKTCEHSHHPAGIGALTLSAEDSPARTSVAPASGQASRASGPGSGLNAPGSFAFFDRDSCSWRTWQLSLFGGLTEFSGNWPRSGSMRNGQCFRRAPWVRHTHGKGCSYWPTLNAIDGQPIAGRWHETGNVYLNSKGNMRRRTKTGSDFGVKLPVAVRMREKPGATGSLNPEWCEWLMGFPTGWSESGGSATPLCPRLRNGSDGES